MQLDHIAIAVHALSKAIPLYETLLGMRPQTTEEVPAEGVRVAFFATPGCHIELIEPLSAESTVGRFLQKNGEGVHHLSFKVADLDDTLKELATKGMQPLGTVRAGSRGTRICFFHPRDTGGVLWELVEHKK